MSARAESPSRGRWWLFSAGVLLAVAVGVLVSGFATASSLNLYGSDFRGEYLGGARAIVHGEPLYKPAGEIDYLAVLDYVYPPFLAIAVVPFTVLPDQAAVVLAVVGCVCAAFGGLAIVGLRDPRCYLAVVASAAMWNLLETANVTGPLVLGLALAWRFRDTVWPLAVAIGLSVAAKIFAWPLVVWAASTGRLRAAVRAVLIAGVATLGAWAAIGFQGLDEYPRILRGLDRAWARDSYSVLGIGEQLHVGASGAGAVSALVGGSLLAACWWFWRQADERRAFTAAVVAALALTPIVWVHYLWLLFVPLALARPRFTPLWLVPLAAWLVPRTGNGDGLQPFVPGALALVLVTFMLLPDGVRATHGDTA